MSTNSSSSLESTSSKKKDFSGLGTIGATMSLPLSTLSSLLAMQDVEDHKPRLSKISWLPDVLVFSSSILPIVLGPVLSVTLFSAGVAAASLWWGKEVGLTNNVVPLLSVVVGLLLVFRNSSAYERYAEGRKDFTSLISNARNLSRNIWVVVNLPPSSPNDDATASPPMITRQQLTYEKKKLIRLVVAFVVATKHHLRAEGGVHHDDLKGLLPPKLAGKDIRRLKRAQPEQVNQYDDHLTGSPRSTSSPQVLDEEATLGLQLSLSTSSMNGGLVTSPSAQSHLSHHSADTVTRQRRPARNPLKRRPTAVRVLLPDEYKDQDDITTSDTGKKRVDERTPLISVGVKPDPVTTGIARRAEIGLGRMVELGLPLIIAHEISRSIFRFRRMGCLEAVGPAGMNALQASVAAMTDQLGSMERIVQTPLPYIFCIHLKQVVSLYLFILPFTLVDSMGWKMVFIMFGISMTFMGVEGIAAMIEMPFGTDPCDLNLDLYCTELLCECEAILERLPEGDEDDVEVYERSAEQAEMDYGADDGGDE
ncbi:hypothetical protein CI109_103059 [Kwoniella shandongensis]|uniref:Uncharacterized protein n=1 Tax=Kwoniella shandongensis TaxID=1734106 RepID=A0A5M6CE53_9TREE|nr:uncharacterized protein CI109_000250 [Kwoniella shandongensis]KAA5531409.1 hypothetical protein CI109_000250 [Kwoniella shandongensis]